MMWFSIISLLMFISGILAQSSSGIVFTGPTTMTARPNPPAQDNCRCVPVGTCNFGPIGIDIRIVNQGQQGCVPGQVWCCGVSQNIQSGCGIRKITNAPVQPTGIAQFGSYPWQVAILDLNDKYLGSGVLLSPDYVLTAAHKVYTYTSGNIILRMGEWDGTATTEPNPYRDYRPASIAIHPSFNSQNLQNDVAIIRLSSSVPVSTSPNINTACFPTSQPATGTRCWVTGWGKNAFDGSYQPILKEVDVPIVDQASCETRLRSTRLGQFFNLDRNSFICAGGETGKDACTGDGGAPLVCQGGNGAYQVVGLVAWGIGCASGGVPGVYVNVFNFLPWITQQMGM